MVPPPLATDALSLLLLLSITAVDAGLSPFARFRDNDQWAPARETHLQQAEAGDSGDLAPPAPTRKADLGAVELFKRYQMGTDTCGFVAEYKSAPWTCNKVAAACNSWGTNIGCCSGTSPPCSSTMVSTCVGYTKDVTRSCATGALCCVSASPSCFTWRFSSSTAPDKTYSAYNCYSQGGTGTLVDQPPQLTQSTTGGDAKGSSDSPTPDLNPSTNLQTPNTRSSSTSSPSASSSTTAAGSSGGDGSSSNNTGTIVGGVVGGVAVIALAGVAIFWLVVRNRRKRAASASSAAPASSAPPSMPASSPNSYYNYGRQGQGQDPEYLASMHQFMTAEQKPPMHGGAEATYPATQQPQQQYAGMPQEGVWTGHTPPQQYGQGLHPPPASHRQSYSPTAFSELGAVNPVGTQGNRAELGSGMGHR